MDQEMLAVIDAYKRRALKRTDVRVFAATLEFRALHSQSKVDLYRIVQQPRDAVHAIA
jgi:hypothetical protein